MKSQSAQSERQQHVHQISVWVRIVTGSPPTDLVADGFGAAPFQEDLLYPAGTGHAETLRTLQFGPGVLGSISERGHSPSDRMVL